MASCHDVTFFGGKLVGDPLDIEMFQATQLKLNDEEIEKNPEGKNTPLAIVYIDNTKQEVNFYKA